MNTLNTTRLLFAALFMVAAVEREPAAQQPDRRGPMPQGTTLDARDGDTVVIDDDARVRVIRRRRAHVRAVFNATERWLIVLARYLPQSGAVSSGVDDAYTFRDIEGNWTLGERWEGETTIEQYSLAGQGGGPAGYGFQTPKGTVQLLGPNQQQFTAPPAAITLVFRGSGRSMERGDPFDQVAARKIDELNGRRTPALSASPRISVVPSADAGALPAAGFFPPGGSARKIHDVRPVWPEEARRAGIQGIVVLELTIGIDGAVTSIKVLRGIPQLDRAAIECARQWRYEPVLVNGQPVPVTITATVTFP